MRHVAGLSMSQLETREQVMEGLARNGIRAAFRAVSLNPLVTAAAGPVPSISTTAAVAGVATLAPVELSAAPDTWSSYVDAVLYPFLLETYTAAAQQTWSFVGDTLHVDTLPIDPLTAEDYLRAAVNRLKNVGNLIWNSIKDTLAEGYEAGETTHQLAARVRNVAKDIGEKRALVIAKTEVISAANAASVAQAQLGGFTDAECSKRWLATDDERTRPEHRLADGQTVGLNQAFSVGGEYLQFPGDPNGRADNVIQCRCTVEFVFSDDDSETLTAAKKWTDADEAKHPRDAHGQFAEKMVSVPKLLEIVQSATSNGTLLLGVNESSGKRIQKSGSGYYVQKLISGKWMNVSEKLTIGELEKKLHGGNWKDVKEAVAEAEAAAGGGMPTPAPKLNPKKPTGKPIHINTNVIYKQKYAHMAVVAEKADAKGEWQLRWNENTKKFVVYKLNGATWVPLTGYGKGEAYKKFSKESDWVVPGSATLTVKSPAEKIGIDLSQKFAHGALIAEKSNPLYGNPQRIVWNDDKKQFVRQTQMGPGWLAVATYDQGQLQTYLEHDPNWAASSGKQVMPGFEPTAPDPNAPVTLASLNFPPGGATAPLAFDAWFAKNLEGKKDVWDKLSDNDKKLVEAGAYNATTFGMGSASTQISTWHTIDASNDSDAALVDKLTNMTNGDFASWAALEVDQAKWDSMSPAAKAVAEKKTATLKAMGKWSNLVAFMDSLKSGSAPPLSPAPKATSKVKVDPDDISGPQFMSPAFNADGKQIAWIKYFNDGSGAAVYSLDSPDFGGPDGAGGYGIWAGLVNFKGNELLEDEVQKLIDNGKLKPTATNTAGTKSIPPLPPPPPPTPSTPPPHGYNHHLSAHSATKFVGDISQPKVSQKSFSDVTTDEMNKLQHDMLLLSGKKQWTPAEKSAVSFYTTKTGYQSMNGVLRNDETRLKLFSDSQLAQAATSAATLQGAMTPLTRNIKLHRGTGAQQFGFETMKISTDKLKKLEGMKITDRGFVSTSVVAPTNISFDYAKKPIKVIINAPEGTPGVYVSSATPGYSHENEFILGAGTNFHVNEVRAATASDKALYGDHTEQVVTLTVVPASKQGPKDISSKGIPGKTAALTTTAPPSTSALPSPANSTTSTLKSTGTLGGKGGVPIKLNTNAIYKQSYPDGAVIAEKTNSLNGLKMRLVWRESNKKFILQTQMSDGTWTNFAGYGKGEAYKKFSGDTDWVTPPPGASALGTSGFGPSVSGTPTPAVPTLSAPALPTPPKKPTAPSKFDAAQLQAMHGTPPLLADTQKNSIWQTFKYGGTPTTLSSQPANIFKKLHKAVEAHNASYPLDKLNLLQALKVIDERASKYTVGGNKNAYEKKILDWLQTPSGKSTATKVLNSSTVTTPSGSTVPGLGLQTLLAKVKNPSELGVPHTKNVTFEPISDSEAQFMQKTMTGTPDTEWTSSQRSALIKYTGDSYKEMNGVLRGLKTSESSLNLSAARSAQHAQDAMRPITRDIIVYRKTDASQFPGLTDAATFNDIKKFEGKVFQDKGFLSTSVEKGTWSGNVEITIEVPEGTPAAYVGGYGNISKHKSEYEMLLAAGLRYRVLSVQPLYSSGAKVRLRVEP